MRSRGIEVLLAASILALALSGAHAQGVGGDIAGHRQRGDKADKSEPPKAKADDKAYNAALRSLPNKPSDPWHGMR
jgi:hypothetical protein